MKHIAIYSRVSSKRQDTKSQKPDLERWAASQERPVRWYSDRFTGKTMDRPGWNKLQAAVDAGEVSAIYSDGLIVACGEGALKITELQPAGSKRMPIAAFAAGRHIEKGTPL